MSPNRRQSLRSARQELPWEGLTRSAADPFTGIRLASNGVRPPLRFGEGWRSGNPEPERREGDYRAAFARAVGALREASQAPQNEPESAARCRELLAAPGGERRQRAFTHARYHHPQVCQRLLDHALEVAEEDPHQARELSELVIELIVHLGTSWAWEALLADLEARGWACLANACRLLQETDEATEALRIAERRLGDGTGDPLEEALVLWLRAQLAADGSDLDAAEHGLDRVIAIATCACHPHQLGRAFLLKAEIWARRGFPHCAADYARHAAACATADSELQTTARAREALYLTTGSQ